ncbi:MAG: hypothetical protein LBK23_08440 [Oscillospiraceae bacterium]|jgi:hypothetical protein|nr:hypothetical protein [Oscillospiraceae bacterium]
MIALILFAASMTVAAYFDFRKMKREGLLRRELIVCALMCLAELAAAAWYFTSAHRQSVMALLLELFKITW